MLQAQHCSCGLRGPCNNSHGTRVFDVGVRAWGCRHKCRNRQARPWPEQVYATPGNEYHMLFIAKGGGSANKTSLYQQVRGAVAPVELCRHTLPRGDRRRRALKA